MVNQYIVYRLSIVKALPKLWETSILPLVTQKEIGIFMFGSIQAPY